MAYHPTGGSWESLGRRWSRDSNPHDGRMQADDHEPDRGQVIYGPKGEVLRRVVDKDIKLGFRKQ